MSTSIASCVTCPNFRKVNAPVGGESIAQCVEHQKVIFVGTLSPSDHLTELAKRCPSAGIPSEKDEPLTYPLWDDFVMTPPKLTGAATLSSCNACVHFKPASSVTGKRSLESPACGAKGEYVDPYSSFDGCKWATEGIPSVTAVSLSNVIFSADAIPVKASAAKKAAAVARESTAYISDPQTYSTDLKVEEEFKGIVRAWRLIEAGEGDKREGYYLPIFEPEYFTSGERLLIPTKGDEDSPELFHDGSGIVEAFTLEVWMQQQALCMVGEPGTGKTEGGRHIAYLTQSPFTHLQITEDTLPDEFLGKTGYSPEIGTHFVWGRLPRAISRPGVVLLDELNTGADSILQTCRSLLASSRTLFLDGEEDAAKHVVKQHDHCFTMLALNPAWDPRNLGVRELADADISRMSYLYVEEPDEATIMQIVTTKLADLELEVSDDELEGMMKVRKDIKEMARSGALPYSWSIRQDVKVAQKMAYYSPATAYKRTLLDYCSPEVGEMVMKAVQSVFGYPTT